MDDTHERRDTVDNQGQCTCGVEEEGTCYVLMNSREYGTHVWPCEGLDEAVETLSRLAWSAEQHRRSDGVQRYFCILGEPPEEEPGSVGRYGIAGRSRRGRAEAHPPLPPTAGLVPRAEEVPCLRLFPREVEEAAA